MREISVNPLNGVTEVLDFEEDGKIHVYQKEDVSGVIERCKQAQNDGTADRGIKKNLWCWASIPTTIYYELIKKGLDPGNPNTSMKRLEAEMKQNYSNFLLTRKNVY
jgi:hypothetical protein